MSDFGREMTLEDLQSRIEELEELAERNEGDIEDLQEQRRCLEEKLEVVEGSASYFHKELTELQDSAWKTENSLFSLKRAFEKLKKDLESQKEEGKTMTKIRSSEVPEVVASASMGKRKILVQFEFGTTLGAVDEAEMDNETKKRAKQRKGSPDCDRN